MSHWFSCGRRDFLIDCTRGGLESNLMVYIGGSNLYFQKSIASLDWSCYCWNSKKTDGAGSQCQQMISESIIQPHRGLTTPERISVALCLGCLSLECGSNPLLHNRAHFTLLRQGGRDLETLPTTPAVRQFSQSSILVVPSGIDELVGAVFAVPPTSRYPPCKHLLSPENNGQRNGLENLLFLVGIPYQSSVRK